VENASNDRSAPLTRTNANTLDAAKLLLRLVLGLLILLHGYSKIKGGPDFILNVVDKAGLPHAFGYLVYVGEVLAPILVIVGFWTRPAASVIAINMIVAVALVHSGQVFSLSPQGGWAIELQAMYLAVAVAVTLLGAGRYSVGGAAGRCN